MNQQGFTLIELLVVIAIIAILASVSVPALQNAQAKAKQNKMMQQAIGIGKALRAYSLDFDGAYPTGEDANEAYAQLFPELGKENVFFVQGSAWHGTGRFKTGPDEQWGEDDDGSGGAGEALEPGENHWAFNNLADAEASAGLAMIADGFTSQVGTYAREKTELGGIWRGRGAIVVFCDNSGKVVKLDSNLKYINKKAKGAIPVKFQLIDADGYLVTNQDITAPPVINVIFNGVVYGDGTNDEEVLEPVGKSNEDNVAAYNSENGFWEYRVATKQFSASGTYSVIVRSGDMNEYTIGTTGGQCNQIFTRQP